MNEWVIGTVIQVKHWNNYLFSLIIHAPIQDFIAGQFTKLALEKNGKRIQRAYSYVNGPKNKNLEFYLSAFPEGKLSSMLYNLKPKDNILIEKKSSGFFILDSIPTCDNLLMFATGTAIGPYLSILEDGEGIKRFKNIVLLHAVRFYKDLNYLSKMIYFQNKYSTLQILTIVSRESVKGSLQGRIPYLIMNGSLEKTINLKINPNNTHVMLCGNPGMVHDVQEVLKNNYNMNINLKNKPGHITSERYW